MATLHEMGFLGRSHRPLGYALSGGAAKGYAHIGVLKVLEAEGIRPDLIAGTSIGAVIGAFSAAGFPATEMERLALGLDLRSLLNLADLTPTRSAIMNGTNVEEFLRRYLPQDFSELDIPLTCVTADLRTGATVYRSDGDLISAVRASISIPMVFHPVEVNDMLLVDGGITEPIPVPAVRAAGARRVIAVSLYSGRPALPAGIDEPSGLRARARAYYERAEVAMAAIDVMEEGLGRSALSRADVVLKPNLDGLGQLSFTEQKALIEAGGLTAHRHIEHVRQVAGVRPT